MSIQINSNGQVNLSKLDAAKYAFHEESFISSLSAFFKGRKITLEKATTYSKDYKLTRLSNRLSNAVKSVETEEEKANKLLAQNTYDDLVKSHNYLKCCNAELKNDKLLTPDEKEIRHQQSMSEVKQRCNVLRAHLTQMYAFIKDIKIQMDAITN